MDEIKNNSNVEEWKSIDIPPIHFGSTEVEENKELENENNVFDER